MKVTVFGGAHPRPGEPAYEEALQLGRLLGQAGHTVLTGGYIGTMEAVSRGAAETGAHVIGVTCEEIERWRQNRANAWVKEEWRYPTLHDRLIALSDGCEAALALPGGAGTLAEISMLWNRLLINAVQPKPLILIGSAWNKVFNELFTDQSLYIRENDRKWLQFADTVGSAVSMLSQK